jgi:hypothetical protein
MLMLALVAVLESIVYVWRYAVGAKLSVSRGMWPNVEAAISTLLVCVTRVIFVAAGVSAFIAGEIVLGGVIYAGTAAIATGLTHWGVAAWNKRKERVS